VGKVTIRDIAKRAGVGVGTVSRVLNQSPAVSEQTRSRVLEIINELEYSPHPIARSLSLGKSLSIGIVLPFLTLPSFVERLRGVQHAVGESEYELVLFSVGSPEQRDVYFTELPRGARVDGLLVLSLRPSDEQVDRFLETELPTVLIDSHHPGLSSVVVDDVLGGYLATKHLIDLGHRKIAYISDVLDNPFRFVSMRERRDGYLKALAEGDIPPLAELRKEGPHGREQARRMALELLDMPDRPTAVFAGSDTQAIGVLDAAKQLGIRVPDQLSVIGYDGIRDAEYVNLTTIEQPLYESGVEGARILLEALREGSTHPDKATLPIRLVTRETTGPPRS
jgi:LacI family transcriptional regulator